MYMCKVLMSIKPKYAAQILNGAKTVEYRKNRFRRQNKENSISINDFVGDLPNTATALSTNIITDLTDKPKFK